MKLSQREKILLSVLGVFVIAWLYYNFAFTPQYAALEETRGKLEELQKKVEDIEIYNDPNGAMQQKYKSSEESIAEATEKYFPEILQERQIRIVDQMLTSAALKGNVLAFSEIAPALVLERPGERQPKDALPDGKTFVLQELADKMNPDPEEAKAAEVKEFSGSGIVEKQETLVEFSGTYPQIINFIKAVETYPKKIMISNINISRENMAGSTEAPLVAGELSGTINIQFYGIPKMHPQQDEAYTTWDIYDVYGRANPYLP